MKELIPEIENHKINENELNSINVPTLKFIVHNGKNKIKGMYNFNEIKDDEELSTGLLEKCSNKISIHDECNIRKSLKNFNYFRICNFFKIF